MNIPKLNTILDDAKQIKDELKLKLHLGTAEVKTELSSLEGTYDTLKSKVTKIAGVAGDSAKELSVAAELGFKGDSKEDVNIALELAANELKSSYKKIQKLF